MKKNLLKKSRAELQAIFDSPLMIDPRRMEQFLAPFREFLQHPEAVADKGKRERGEPFGRKGSSTAIIPIVGSLTHRANWITEWLGLPTYEGLSRQIELAVKDSTVEDIVLMIDSPGGQAAGVFDLADEIRAAGAQKNIVAIAEDWATSAAYMIGSAANKFYATQTGVTGSIGVVMAHVDQSKALERWGLKVTTIQAGAKKTVGSPFKPLSDEDRAELQQQINSLYDVFTSKVAEFRGMEESAVRATEAGIFTGAEAVNAGLIDGIATSAGVIGELNAPPADNSQAAYASVPARPFSATFDFNPGEEPVVTVAGVEVQPDDFLLDFSDPDAVSLVFPTRATQTEPTTPPPQAGTPEGGHMSATDKEGGDVVSLEKKLQESQANLAAEKAKTEAQAASLAEVQKREKERVIDAHTTAGRIVPAMRPAIDKMAEHMDANELDVSLSTFPVLPHTDPAGIVESDATGDTAEDRDVSRTLGIPLSTIRKFGNVRTLRFDGTAVMMDGTVEKISDLEKRGA